MFPFTSFAMQGIEQRKITLCGGCAFGVGVGMTLIPGEAKILGLGLGNLSP